MALVGLVQNVCKRSPEPDGSHTHTLTLTQAHSGVCSLTIQMN